MALEVTCQATPTVSGISMASVTSLARRKLTPRTVWRARSCLVELATQVRQMHVDDMAVADPSRALDGVE